MGASILYTSLPHHIIYLSSTPYYNRNIIITRVYYRCIVCRLPRLHTVHTHTHTRIIILCIPIRIVFGKREKSVRPPLLQESLGVWRGNHYLYLGIGIRYRYIIIIIYCYTSACVWHVRGTICVERATDFFFFFFLVTQIITIIWLNDYVFQTPE